MYKRILFLFLFLLLESGSSGQKPGDKVTSIYVDEYGHQWFGTDRGLLRKCGDVWKSYSVQGEAPIVVNFIKHKIGLVSELWIGTTTGIIKISYSSSNIDSSKVFKSIITGFQSDNIKSIDFDNEKNAYFATPRGIGIYANFGWRFYTKLVDVFKNEFTSAGAMGDTIYLGTFGEGVARIFKYADGYSGASSFISPWSALPGDSITCILIDSERNQWYGTTKGIVRHSDIKSKEGWNLIFTDELPNIHINSLAEDKQGNIWIGTMNGLAKLNNDFQTITTWNRSDGLPSDTINTIFIDKDQSVWIGTNNGVSHFSQSIFSNTNTSNYAKNFILF